MKKLLTPRGYISWTQVDMWLRSKERYKQRYFYDTDDFTNKAMDFGKKASTAMETGETDGDDSLEIYKALMPHYEFKEHEMKVLLETPAGEVYLLGKLDTFSAEPLRFREHKTGVTKWTQAKAQNHKQIHHYQTMIWLEHKKLASDVHLDWAQTEYVNGEVCFTGNITSFKVNIGMKEVLEYMVLVARVAKEIDEEYRKYLKTLA